MTLFCMDYIGAAKYPKIILAHHPKGFGAGFLLEIDGFGNAASIIESLAKLGICPVFRIHLVWKDDHRFGIREKELAIKRCKALLAIIKKYPLIQWYVSPFLEASKTDKKIFTQTIEDCRKLLPTSVKMVASSLEGTVIPNAITEMHGDGWKEKIPGATIFSFDGMEIVDADVQAWKNKTNEAELFFIWKHTFNGKFGEKDKRKRSERTSWPNPKDLVSCVPYALPKGDTKLPDKWLYKSHAERFLQADAKSNTPTWIAPIKAPLIELKVNDKVVAEFEFTADYHEGDGYIYRIKGIKKWGYEIRREVGGVLCDVYINNKNVGKINPAYRDGYYRN